MGPKILKRIQLFGLGGVQVYNESKSNYQIYVHGVTL